MPVFTGTIPSLIYFISDLHLSEQRPDITACFLTFLEDQAAHAEALYILGDLFEVWLGDDDITPFSQSIELALQKLSREVPIYFIHGNRDFAIGQAFATRSGIQLLNEQCVIDLHGRKALIMHGDELCTKDIEYQKFRKKARGWWWPKLMLALPLRVRKRLARKGRAVSQENQKHLTKEIMDVTQEEVEKSMQAHQVDLLIHGHTHRPAVHEFDGKTRIVLGDWYDQGSYLIAQDSALELKSISM